MTVFTREFHTGFGDTNFGILWDSFDPYGMPGWAQESFSVTRHIPGGDVNVTQLLGHGALGISYRLFFENTTEFDTFMALRHTSETLTVYAVMCELDVPEVVMPGGGVYKEIPDVTLMGVGEISKRIDGCIECTAAFQIQERPA